MSFKNQSEIVSDKLDLSFEKIAEKITNILISDKKIPVILFFPKLLNLILLQSAVRPLLLLFLCAFLLRL